MDEILAFVGVVIGIVLTVLIIGTTINVVNNKLSITDRDTKSKCFEQTQNQGCWGLK